MMAKSVASKSGPIQSVDRALQILLLLHENANMEMSIREISSELGLNKSTAFCLLQTMKARGIADQNPENSKYRMGTKMMEIGLSMASHLELGKVARPCLKQLVDQYSETAHLVIRDGDQVVYVDKISASNAVGIISYVGKHNPIYCTGVGKCILAHLPPDVVERTLPENLIPFTMHTITDKKKLYKELEQIRVQGYGFDREEIELGLHCVAAPVFDAHAEVCGAISLSGPAARMDEPRLLELVNPVKQCADEISRQMGFLQAR